MLLLARFLGRSVGLQLCACLRCKLDVIVVKLQHMKTAEIENERNTV